MAIHKKLARTRAGFWAWFAFGDLILLGECSPIYTPPWGWAVGIDLTQYPTPAEKQKALAEARERFRPDLTACVSENDPQHLHEMDNGGEYQISGWFVSTARTAPVQRCMSRKGWQPYPS
jgi:hypothetical protein